MEEVHTTLKPPQSRVILVLSDGDSIDNATYTHTLWKVRMQDGSTHAVDLTGAQYGWHEEPTVPWSKCQRERCDTILHVNPSGTEHDSILDIDSVGDGFSVWKKDVMTRFDENMERRIAKDGWTARDFLSISDAAFEVIEKRYLAAVSDAVSNAAATALDDWCTWSKGQKMDDCTNLL